MKLSRFDYTLDPSLIATMPLAERDRSRLLVYHRRDKAIEHRSFRDILDYLDPADLLVFNDTRVFPARLRGRKKTGGKIEILCLRSIASKEEDRESRVYSCEVLLKGHCKVPLDIVLMGDITARLTRDLEDGRKELKISLPRESYADVFEYMEKWGEVPLPPYIVKRRRPDSRLREFDRVRYQTVYAKRWGSAAAPTAGLHFTKPLVEAIEAKGVRTAATTLHIGIDTFRPIRTASVLDHKMHEEWYAVSPHAAEAVNGARRRGGKVFSVGTTVTRALESASQVDGTLKAAEGKTDLFITPGYIFRGIDALITNFHQPKSTLMVLVTAFVGEKAVESIYCEAMQRRYRFYSYGDAMLIL